MDGETSHAVAVVSPPVDASRMRLASAGSRVSSGGLDVLAVETLIPLDTRDASSS